MTRRSSRTIHLEEDLRRALRRLALAEGRSEAEILREVLREKLMAHARPAPGSVGAGGSRDPGLAGKDEVILARGVPGTPRRRRS